MSLSGDPIAALLLACPPLSESTKTMTLTRKRSAVAPACLMKTSRRRLITPDKTSRSELDDHQTPQQQVLRDPKLLEAILVRVGDMRTLLLSERVDRNFRGCIRGSALLRQQLWLDPNPRIQMWHAGRLNPLLSRSVAHKKHKKILSLTHSGCDVCILTTMSARELQVTGSWREMLVYQPHSPFAVFKTADCWASSESFRQNNFTEAPRAGKLVEIATTRSRNPSAQSSVPERPTGYDRRCGRPAAGYVVGRAKVFVPY